MRRLSRCKRTLSRAPGAESCNQQAWDLESRQRAFKIDRDQGLSGYDGLRFSRNYTQGRTHGGKSLTEGPLPLRPKFAEGGGGSAEPPPLLVIIIAIII